VLLVFWVMNWRLLGLPMERWISWFSMFSQIVGDRHLDHHQICVQWSPGVLASRLSSVPRSSSNVTKFELQFHENCHSS